MDLEPLPDGAAWTHLGDHHGFEVLFSAGSDGPPRLRGHTTAREGSSLWAVGYDITLDAQWQTRSAQVTGSTRRGAESVVLTRLDGDRWEVDGTHRPELDGCVDVDIESSAVTNTLPIHRLDFASGQSTEVPAAFVRAEGLGVERLEQRYTLIAVEAAGFRFRYESTTFDVACELTYDRAGLIVHYPEVAAREY